MIIRFLDHSGIYQYFTGTDNQGSPQWAVDANAAFVFESESTAQKVAQRCVQIGHDVEITL